MDQSANSTDASGPSSNSGSAGGIDADGFRIVDPSTFGADFASKKSRAGSSGNSDNGNDAGTGAKRGRKPGSRNKAQEKGPLSVSGIETLLFSIHMLLSSQAGIPELKLERSEAQQLAEAIAEVAKHYPVELDPKTIAWGQLIMVAGSIYGPRAYLAYRRTQQEKQGGARGAQTDAPKVVFPDFGFGGPGTR